MMAEAGKRKIFLRADANSEIGYGHFMRTLALAEVLAMNYDCVFATQSPTAFQKACLKDVCGLIELPSDETRFQLFANIVKEGDIVVLDNYFYDFEYENLLRSKGASVVLIDNLHMRHSCADAIIGFSMGLKLEDYSVESYTKLYLGPNYSLLRRPFLEQLKRKHPALKKNNKYKIVVSFGGADCYGIAASIANILESSNLVSSITVIGNNSEALFDSSKIELKSQLSANEMRDVFVSRDIAVLPTSTTTLEAFACGIPVIGGYFVDNQVNSYNQYVRANAIIGCGDLRVRSNQMKVKSIIESNSIGEEFQPKQIIPLGVEQKLLSVFESL